jgi:hypothetical protein
MSFYDAIRVGASGAVDFEVERSLRFNDSDAPKLQRTLGSSGNRKTFTWSGWVKRAALAHQALFSSTTEVSSGNSHTYLLFNSSHQLVANSYNYSGGTAYNLITTQLFRDPSAWYHIVYAVDTTQSTSSNRIKLYLNGEQITSFSTAAYPSQNYEGLINNSSYKMLMGNAFPSLSNNSPFDGYLAEATFIDGLQLTPASFGETNAATGQWVPIDTSGLTFGTNGFRLKFADNSGTSATTLGKDSSGNGNNFTPSGFSVAAGTGNDSVTDTPTNNFPTANPVDTVTGTLANGNLDISTPTGSAQLWANFVIPKTGKWYIETTMRGSGSWYSPFIVATNYLGFQGTGYTDNNLSYYNNGDKRLNNSETSYGASFGTNDVIAMAIDVDNSQVTFYKNGASQGAISFSFDSRVDYYIGFTDGSSYSGADYSVNFGQLPFANNPPTGFETLCSANLPDPTILLPNQHFNTLLYTGNDSSNRDITGVGFQPDWLWIKNRSQADFHCLQDSVRGANKIVYSNDTDNEQTDNSNGHVNSFLPDGFNVDAGASGNVNENNENYVAWNWNAGDTDSATYRVVVVSDSGNKYRFRNSANTATFAQSAVTLNLAEGGTYTFDQSDSTMSSHPMKLSTTANGTHGGGSSYNTGVTYELDGSTVTESAFVSGFSSATSRKLIITVAASAPTLYYFCHYHSGMGGQANTNSTLGSTNFDGTSLAVVKANTTAGFSIVTYTGTGSTTTVGHGLGVAPKVVLTRSRSSGGSWGVLHTASNPTAEHRINLNDNGGFSSYQGYNIWADTVPTSTVFTVNSDSTTNASSVTYVGYLFNEVEGYSKFGIYKGNGASEDGPFVFTGHRPAWIMFKNVNTSTWWFIYDVKRETFNVMKSIFGANVADAEYYDSHYEIDILSNGFKIRGQQPEINKSGDTISYFSFAESPFKNSRAR